MTILIFHYAYFCFTTKWSEQRHWPVLRQPLLTSSLFPEGPPHPKSVCSYRFHASIRHRWFSIQKVPCAHVHKFLTCRSHYLKSNIQKRRSLFFKKVGKLLFPPNKNRTSFSRWSLLTACCLWLTQLLGLILCNFTAVKPIAKEIFYRLTVPALYGLCINNLNPHNPEDLRKKRGEVWDFSWKKKRKQQCGQ